MTAACSSGATEVTDAGLAHLESLKKLKALYLWMTKVTDAVSNRGEMHSGVRNATEFLQQEIGQAGRVAFPNNNANKTLSTAVAAAGAATVTVQLQPPGAPDYRNNGGPQPLVISFSAPAASFSWARPSRIAPEDTSTTSQPLAFSAAIWRAQLPSASRSSPAP